MKPSLYTFQQQLKSMIGSGDLPPSTEINTSTLANASIMIAIIPFMILYPFLQKYFVKGVNIGAVKE